VATPGDKVQDINETEWSKPENWSGPKLLGLYASKIDTRLWVPKRTPALGWTINIGHPGGMALLVGILVGIACLLIGACILVIVLIDLAVVALRHVV
jgi:uncharacterized membrane protein